MRTAPSATAVLGGLHVGIGDVPNVLILHYPMDAQRHMAMPSVVDAHGFFWGVYPGRVLSRRPANWSRVPADWSTGPGEWFPAPAD